MFPQFNWHIMHLGLLVRWLLYYVGTYREVLCKNWLIALHARVFDKHVFSTSTSDTQGGFLVSTPFLWKGDSNKTLTTHNLVHLLQIILAQEKNIQQLTELIQSLQVQLLHCRGGNSTAHGASLNQSSVSYTEAEGHAIVNDWSPVNMPRYFASQYNRLKDTHRNDGVHMKGTVVYWCAVLLTTLWPPPSKCTGLYCNCIM